MNITELRPSDGRKSFYGKALVLTSDNKIQLQSYNTIVCEIENGIFKRLWGGYSATTMRHINAFIKAFNIQGGGKKWWDSLEVLG